MSEIEPYDYFGPEASDPFYVYVLLYYWVFNREKLNEPYYSLKPLYLRDLVKSAEAKRWIPPEATVMKDRTRLFPHFAAVGFSIVAKIRFSSLITRQAFAQLLKRFPDSPHKAEGKRLLEKQ